MATPKQFALLSIFFIFFFCEKPVSAEPTSHQGWNVGGAGVLHTFYLDTDDDNNRNPPSRIGGGVNLFGGRRFQKWELRLNFDVAGVQVEESKTPDSFVGISLSPMYHFRRNPKKWDPYLVLPEIGFMHLFRNVKTGPTIVFPGAGLQIHWNEKISFFMAFKLRWGLLFLNNEPGVTVDGEFPIGVVYKF